MSAAAKPTCKTESKSAKEVGPDAELIIAYKGFDKDLKCRDYQYNIGGTYAHEGVVMICNAGFHSCENPLDVFGYYEPGIARFALVQASGSISRETGGDSKIASAQLHIKAELTMPELIGHATKWITNHCTADKSNHATGGRSASSATGCRSASSATGNSSASSATGYRSASSATGVAAVALNTGLYGKASASEGAAIVLCFHNDDKTLKHIRCSKVGENGIKPDTFYTLNSEGEFVLA